MTREKKERERERERNSVRGCGKTTRDNERKDAEKESLISGSMQEGKSTEGEYSLRRKFFSALG